MSKSPSIRYGSEDRFYTKPGKNRASVDDCVNIFTILRTLKGQGAVDPLTGDCTIKRPFPPVSIDKRVPYLTNAVVKFYSLIHYGLAFDGIEPVEEEYSVPSTRKYPLFHFLSLCEGPDSVFYKALLLTEKVVYFGVGEELDKFSDVVTYVEDFHHKIVSGEPTTPYDFILFDPAGNENSVENWFANSNVAGSICDYAYSCLDKLIDFDFEYLVLKLRPIHSIDRLEQILGVASMLQLVGVFSNPIDCKQEIFLILKKGNPVSEDIFYGTLHTHLLGVLSAVYRHENTLATPDTIGKILKHMGCKYVVIRDEESDEATGIRVTSISPRVYSKLKGMPTARSFLRISENATFMADARRSAKTSKEREIKLVAGFGGTVTL